MRGWLAVYRWGLMMGAKWEGAIAVVTGGGSGIGRALCLALAKRGARVVVTDVDGTSAANTAKDCGENASACVLDVRDAAAVKSLIEATATTHGRLDYLFNNAGIGVGGEAHEIPLDAWDRCIDINIRGVVHGVVAAYPLMVKQRSGHIINTASLAGLGPTPLLTPYSMTKHAVVGLSTSLRIEAVAFGVKVSAVCPAAIETPLLDNMPSDLAQLPGRPNIRRHLTNAGGAPYPVAAAVDEMIRGIENNEALIVIPSRARLLWRIARLSPALVELGGRDAVKKERAARDAGAGP